MKIILASKSPRRRKLMKELRLNFQVMFSRADESKIDEENPRELARKIAMLKAATVAKKFEKEPALVIGADTLVVAGGEVLGKPKSKKEAREMLTRLSGREHFVYTGICVINTKNGNVFTDVQKTRIRLRELGEKELERYVSTDNMDWAGAYAVQHQPSLIYSIDGSYTNVIGLPTEKLIPILRENGVDI